MLSLILEMPWKKPWISIHIIGTHHLTIIVLTPSSALLFIIFLFSYKLGMAFVFDSKLYIYKTESVVALWLVFGSQL